MRRRGGKEYVRYKVAAPLAFLADRAVAHIMAVSDDEDALFPEILAAMGQELPNQLPAPRAGETCSRCGGSLQDFRESGRLGCPDCYRTFEAPLRDLLRRLHGSTQHVGERYADKEIPPTTHAPPQPHAAELHNGKLATH